MKRISWVLVLLLGAATASFAGGNADAPLVHRWVVFQDKGVWETLPPERILAEARAHGLTYRAIERRRLEGIDGDSLATLADLPPDSSYLAALVDLGADIRCVSRWFNRASVAATPAVLDRIAALPFVKSTRLIGRLEPTGTWYEEVGTFDGNPAPGPGIDLPGMYGPSYLQALQVDAVEAHREGYTGRGVVMAVLDGGFELSHEAYERINVLATWDVINNDDDVGQDPEQDAPGQAAHGTGVLSVIAGYSPGNLIGIAYEASFVLAKTEYVPTETVQEEDNYVAAIEWAERLGAKVSSSSLGYTDWYNAAMMDGETPITSRALDRARKLGMVCVSSASNEGPQPMTLGAPGDSWGALTAGAEDSLGRIARFSSRGPTADGRTKPDLVARGVHTVCVRPYSNHSFSMWNGTSLSAPVLGGVVALVRGAHPDWSAERTRRALKTTADRADRPDNVYGWGTPDVMAAIRYPEIRVKVVDSNLEPLEGVTVALTRKGSPDEPGKSAVCGEDGIASFPNLDEGTWSYSVSLPGGWTVDDGSAEGDFVVGDGHRTRVVLAKDAK